MLDEKSLRRPGFRDDNAIILADGQPWIFPEVLIRFAPAPPPEFRVRRSNLGQEHLRKIAAVTEAITTDDLINSELDLAAWVLLTNYDLTYDQIGELILFDYHEGADQTVREQVMEACLGLGPKPSAGGGN